MNKTIDQLMKSLPKKHNLTVNRDDNGISINISATKDDGSQSFGITVRVDGDLKQAAKAVEVATEIVKESN